MAFAFYLLMPTLPIYLTGFLHISNATTGIIMSVYVIAALLMRPLAGFLIDKFPRKMLYVISFACFVLLFVAYLEASGAAAFLILRLLHGLVWGVITTSGNTIAIDIVPPERRGEGIGYYGMSMNLAMACGPLVGLLLCEYGPFVHVFQMAIISATLGFILAFLMRVPHKKPHPHSILSLDRFILIKGIPAGVALICITIAYGLILTYAAMYGKQNSIPNPGIFFVAMAAGIIVARLFSSKLLDRGMSMQVAIVGGLISAASLLLLGLFPVSACYFISAGAVGIGYGMTFPAVQHIIVNHGDHHQRGTANSTFFTAFDFGVGLGILLGGQIAQHFHLSIAFILVSISTLLGALLLWRLPKGASIQKL